MAGRSSTHLLEVRPDVVIKRYRSWGHQQPEREWRALELLAEHAPGLAPRPVSADLFATPPTVVMSRLAGLPLEGSASSEQIDALAVAIARLQEAIPMEVLAELPPRAGHPAELLQQVRAWCAELLGPNADPLVAKALATGLDWVGRPGLAESLGRQGRPVFGTGDGNLANYLWDGSEVQVVDFEYSGRSDRSYELAEVTEHISVWAGDGTGLTPMLERFELDPAEAARLKDCRRLLALFWLLRVLSSGQGESESGSRVLVSQAKRLLDLLD